MESDGRRLARRLYIFSMLPFCLYFVAGLATGFHVYTLLALTVYGVPFNSLEFVSLLGSVGLLIAAFISLFKPYAAARIAFIACLMTWSFYGPAIANVVRTKFDSHSALPANPSNRWTQPFALVSR